MPNEVGLKIVLAFRFAAMAAITCAGEPKSVADSIRAMADELKERAGWFGELSGSLRFIVAAMLAQTGDMRQISWRKWTGCEGCFARPG